MKHEISRHWLLILSCAISLPGCSGSDSGESREGSDSVAPPTVNITGTLNDTGMTSCSSEAEPQASCPQAAQPNQDAEFGRDAQALRQQLEKTGAGIAGFDWSKIDSSGNLLAVQNTNWDDSSTEHSGKRWSCVLDNVTELMWEVKESDPQHPRYSEHTYSWFNSDPSTNGGVAGLSGKGTCGTAECDTQGYVNWVNETGLCGHKDWRMPTVNELASIAVLSKVVPAMDEDFFPNTSKPRFFTALSNAKDPNHAWYVYFSDGSVSSTSKADLSHVRLVRGGQK